MKISKKLSGLLGWIITILIPVIILMISIRLMISPAFAQIEYRLPGFPDDPYGFTLDDRKRWSEPAINYLVNSEGIEFLEVLKFDNGEPIFIDRELSHMQDVKAVVTGMRIALVGVVVVVSGVTVVMVKSGKRDQVLKAYRHGGWGLVGLIAAILIFVTLNFDQLFTWFHQLFFESGTWQFYTSDTLIRLFPMRFWQDAFIFVGLLSLILAGLIILLCREPKSKRKI